MGVIPDAVVGHSSGEIAAAYTIGGLSLESACQVAYHRGRLAQRLSQMPGPGSMVSVNIPEADVDAYLDRISLSENICVACVNSPLNVTLSGNDAAIRELAKHLTKDGIFARELKTGVAYHSPAMQQISEEYHSCLSRLEMRQPNDGNILMISSVTGQKVPVPAISEAQYWVDNLVSPVQFASAVQYLASAAPKVDNLKPISTYIEIGPHGALRRSVKDTLSAMGKDKGPTYLSILSRFESPVKTALEVVGQLFAYGYPVSVTAANQQHTGINTRPFLVDAPGYPFNHSQVHWHETRLSRDWRLRKAVSRSLLGVSVADWNPLEPRWRKVLRAAEIPWLADHVIGESILFPATGSIIMALEAVRQTQMTTSNQTISGYTIKEAVFMTPIVIRAENGTEVITQTRPLDLASNKIPIRFEVRIFMVADKHWTECFRSTIHIEYAESANEVEAYPEDVMATQIISSDYVCAQQTSTIEISKRDFYNWHHNQGVKYGNSFSLVKDIRWDGDQVAIAHIDVGSPVGPYEGVVHPAILDAACQVCYVAPSGGMSKELPTNVPYRVRDAWISARGWKYPCTRLIRVLTKSKIKSIGTGIECSIQALSDDGSLLCRLNKFDMLPIMSNKHRGDSEKNMLHRIDWRPQLSLLSPSQLHRYCDANHSEVDESSVVNYSRELDSMLRSAFQQDFGPMMETKWTKAPSHMENYVSFMKYQLQKVQGEPLEIISQEDLTRKLEQLSHRRPSWRMFVEVAQNLPSIIREDFNASEFLLSKSLLQDFYEDIFKNFFDDRLISYFQLMAHETSSMRILEVGAGSGAMASLVLSILELVEESTGGVAFCEYVYTDPSSSYLERARERFSKYRSRMTFMLLDPGQGIVDQGFLPASFDVVLTGGAFHATGNMPGLLQGIRCVLKPGGHLIFCENTAPDCFTLDFGFGVLPDWWCGEDRHVARRPIMTEPEWETVLRENGFSGNDLVIRDYADNVAHHTSIIVSSIPYISHIAGEGARVWFVVHEVSFSARDLAMTVAESFESLGLQTIITHLTQLSESHISHDDYVILLTDLGDYLLTDVSESIFGVIKNVMQRPRKILWLTSSCIDQSSDVGCYPYAHIKDGLLRTLRTEFGNKHIISLSVEDIIHTPTCVSNISKVCVSAFGAQFPEPDYVVREGQILTRRLIEDTKLNYELSSSIRPLDKSSPWLPGPPLKVDIESRGQLDTLHFSEDSDYHEELGPIDVEIEARAWAINFRDILTALGQLPDPEFGSDCAGIVTRVGAQCESVQPGDRVCMCATGCMRMYPRSSEDAVMKIPPSVSFEEACAVINPGMTAWYSLMDIAKLSRGERILIHAASGATGQLAIQIAQKAGAEIFVTVGDNRKKELLINQYGIPADHFFYSRSNNTTFAKGIMRMTDGHGVDVVLNSLSGNGLRASWECIAPYGRFIEIGKKDIDSNSPLPMTGFANNVTFAAVDIRHIMLHRKQLGKNLFHKTMALNYDGTIHCPQPLHLYDISAVEDAFRYIQSGKNSGRTIVRIDPSTIVRVCVPRILFLTLLSQSRYQADES